LSCLPGSCQNPPTCFSLIRPPLCHFRRSRPVYFRLVCMNSVPSPLPPIFFHRWSSPRAHPTLPPPPQPNILISSSTDGLDKLARSQVISSSPGPPLLAYPRFKLPLPCTAKPHQPLPPPAVFSFKWCLGWVFFPQKG